MRRENPHKMLSFGSSQFSKVWVSNMVEERAFRPASDVRVNGLYSLRKNELSELICNRA